MSVCWLSSSPPPPPPSPSSCFTSLMVVAVGGRGRHLVTTDRNWWWSREGGTSLVNCTSNPNSSRGFGRPPPQFNTNNNTTEKKKKMMMMKKKNNKNNKKKKLDNSNPNSNSNSVLMPGLSTSPGGGIDSTNRLRTPPPRITSNNTSNDIQFDQRLQAIRRSALEQKKLVQNSLYGAIEYDQPPEAPGNNTDTPKLVGLGTKIGIGVAVVIFGFVFALGDFLPTSSDTPSEEATVVDSKLSAEEMKNLQARLQQFEASLTVTPKDPKAMEGAAVTLAELGEYSRASSLLDDLTKMKPNDPDAFRLLGEVRYQLKDYEGSAAAYKSSAMVSKTINFDVLRGLTNALLAAKRPDEAVQVLLASRERLNAKTLADGQTESKEVDPIQVELLLGKAYSDWGRINDAVLVYDQLISSHPDDFRGYLAKGIILKENGRSGDAERMFIQARFFAPEKAKALVDRYSRK